jgi:hypothetical protein
MKQIQAVVFPLNLGTAIYLSVASSDNCVNMATIYYQLLDTDSNTLQKGNLYMSGIDYDNYNSSNDGNQYVYEWTATQLNVTLI